MNISIEWPKYDPSRGYFLCKSCWDGNHFNPPYKDKFGVRHPKTSNCKEGGCDCGCIHNLAPKKNSKPDYSKQMTIDEAISKNG